MLFDFLNSIDLLKIGVKFRYNLEKNALILKLTETENGKKVIDEWTSIDVKTDQFKKFQLISSIDVNHNRS